MPRRLDEELELSVTVTVTITGLPPVNDEELDETLVVVLSGVARPLVVLVELDAVVSCAVLLLDAWVPSPEYCADISTVSGEFIAVVYEVEHVSDEMIQDSGVNDPPA